MQIKVAGIGLPVDWLIMWAIDALSQLADKMVAGEELSDSEILGARTLYYLIKEHGQRYAESTDTPWDDKAFESLIALIEDTAEEGGFNLPTVPPIRG